MTGARTLKLDVRIAMKANTTETTKGTTTFETWGLCELFGHQKIAGQISELSIGGASFIRVDVPAVNGDSPFTRIFNPSAIYSMTPTGEEYAKAIAAQIHSKPIDVYMPRLEFGNQRQIEAISELDNEEDISELDNEEENAL